MIDSTIKNLIFDFGGVILNLSIESTLRQLAEASKIPVDEIRKIYLASPELMQYEKGLISDAEFRLAMKNVFRVEASDELIDGYWNAMLLDIPAERIALLKDLKAQYRTFLLSNTNNIHLIQFTSELQKAHGINKLDDLFHRAYYSHLMNMRKPDAEIFLRVLEENNLEASETLFLDDNLDNLKGAAQVGIQTFHVQHPDLILSLFR